MERKATFEGRDNVQQIVNPHQALHNERKQDRQSHLDDTIPPNLLEEAVVNQMIKKTKTTNPPNNHIAESPKHPPRKKIKILLIEGELEGRLRLIP
jgi:hypothetical protein